MLDNFKYKYYFLYLMASVATIKGVDSDAWRLFKTEAARHGVTMGAFFNDMIKRHAADELMTREEAFQVMDELRAKSGKWSGSKEVFKWRKKHMF